MLLLMFNILPVNDINFNKKNTITLHNGVLSAG